ncbi:putative glycerol kinase 5 isoform X2 [Coccinella septempunctata]|uniref:putative glycerol kinase 5 isoform X2 n=1 Tax=Coccinella septempunctata TaxID=41139 RepID=UPI001D062D97|nr:putative glycerol kinase 5 isoform X2 [Coccinella septempunctata]
MHDELVNMSKIKENEKFICLDIGTTTLRCLIIDSDRKILGSSFRKVQLVYPEEGHVEIDPSWLWENVVGVVNSSLIDANITSADVKSLGICTQRGTFLTWRKDTGKHFHNFITWKDVRSRGLIEDWNESVILKTIRLASRLLYLVTRNGRYQAGSKLKMACSHASSRLLWVLENIPNIKEEIEKDNVMFGTLDTWLIYKLTKNKTFVTDISNASATGFFDPFTLGWGSWAINILKIPRNILPPIVDNDYNFGTTDVFGSPIEISTVLADQSAAMLGSYCFNKNDLKVTIGTGAFINENTGEGINCHLDGMYPLVGWKFKGKLTYINEAPCSDGGSLIEWLKVAGYIEGISDLKKIIDEAVITDDLFFVPAFSGLGPPINDAKAATGFIGIQPTTTRNKMVVAILESIVFRVALAFQSLKTSSNYDFKKICIDGGVSKNDFICQQIANATGLEVEKAEFEEIAALGILFACGLCQGLWSDMTKLKRSKIVEKVYKADFNSARCEEKMIKWRKAAERFRSWYK